MKVGNHLKSETICTGYSAIYRKAANTCFSFVNMNAKILEIQIFAKSGA